MNIWGEFFLLVDFFSNLIPDVYKQCVMITPLQSSLYSLPFKNKDDNLDSPYWNPLRLLSYLYKIQTFAKSKT